MKMRIGDIKPGQLFYVHVELGGPEYKSIFLKCRDQKAVNMDTYAVVKPNQEEEVEVLQETLTLVKP